MRFVLRILVVIYGMLCVLALGWLLWRGSGWFGPADPLSAVYAIGLSMPWSLMLDRVPGNIFLLKVIAIAIAMAVNFGIGRLLTRPRYRRW